MGTTRKGSEWSRIGVALALAIVLAATSQCGGRRSEQFRQQGDTYLRLEKPADAMIEYDRALSADPRNALAKLGVARVYAAQQRPDDAVKTYREAIKLDPVLVPAYAELAALSVKQGNASEAEALARELQGRDPEKGGLLLAHVEQVTGRGEAAIATLTALREQFPRSLEARVALGGAYLQAGQAAKAEEEARAALNDLDPQALPARMMLIEAFRVQGKLSDLIAEIEEMIKRQEEVVAAAPGDAAAREALDNHKL
ncbi:MAG TPA: tetratricopeptide repeat protein, partial [Candidatus Hydrogenedentes bacterium]|nr:tetratricopeptide repeat protein [Candidatus Hydrogenedentota bacterium]